jgi:hypothetical protein
VQARRQDRQALTRRDAGPVGRGGGEVGEVAVPEELGSVRYLVDDVDAAVAFYAGRLGFVLGADARPALAELVRGSLRLILSGPASTARRPMPDGRWPAAGGWNRIHLVVDVVSGPGGRQVLVEDPSGNPVEIFEPAGA